MTFDPHPASILRPGLEPTRLSTIDQRRRWLKEAGADEVVAIPTTPELLRCSPEEFIERYVLRHSPCAVIEGADFHFGHRRAGSIHTLRQQGSKSGFEVIVADEVETSLTDQSLVRVSSSQARWLVERGRVGDAALLLGRPFELRCRIVPGDRRGREIGYPTMNLDHADYALPADGIYAGQAILPDGSSYMAAISVGTKPTFGSSPRVCEAHILDYQGPLDDYGWIIELRFTQWLRDQLKYDSVEMLIDQLHRDVRAVRERAAMAMPIREPAAESSSSQGNRSAKRCAAS